jgi:uncharacterized protein (DUF2236 family)
VALAAPARAAAGPPAPADQGLFGPGSVSWRILAEQVMWVAGYRALYLQALHPRVMRATWQHSALARPGEAWGRFVRTAEFIMIRTYGSTAAVEQASRRVRKIHAALVATDADGSVYRLDEPDLLLWVHCGEISSYADVARRCGMPLSAADLDQFIDEQRRSAAVVGLDPQRVPGSMAAMDAYYLGMRPRLEACTEARQALRRSLTPDLPWQLAGLRVVVPPFAALAFASLPRWARKLYGTPGSRLTDLSTTLTLRGVYQATSMMPRPLQRWPAAMFRLGDGSSRTGPAPPGCQSGSAGPS